MVVPAGPTQPQKSVSIIGRLVGFIGRIPHFRRLSSVFGIYTKAGGSLLAEGLAYSALFAGLTGLLLAVALLVNGLTGQLAPLAPVAGDGLRSLASNAGGFSILGLIGLAWGASHFYGSLDEAISRVFARAPARGTLDRIVRQLVSVFVLVGALLSGIALSAIQAIVSSGFDVGPTGDAGRIASELAFPMLTAVVVVVSVGVLYRVVPNTKVPIRVLWLPTLVAGLVLTGLTELLVYITPLLTGALSVFGGVAAVFAALAWLHLAFQVLLMGAAWTRLRLDEAGDD
jgi:membrane protein